jgi:hypothetical protein
MTGRNKVLLLVLSALFLGNVQTRVFSRSELARALYDYGFPEYQLNDCKYFNTLTIVSSNIKAFMKFVDKLVSPIDL